MQKILIIGAGKSASVLIEYLLRQSEQFSWQIIVGDLKQEIAEEKINKHPSGKAIHFDVNDDINREAGIKDADIVISMLPASLHLIAAKDCLKFNKHLLTASYVAPEIEELDAEVKKKGLLFMEEMGLDPGIDHMSAMKKIHEIKDKGAKLISFKSYTGGLIAPESDNNPWNYKFTWNPKNVILAGKGTATYLLNGKRKYTPYNRLFLETEKIEVDQYGIFEGYSNRDSLHYIEKYGLEEVATVLRGTLRKTGYCQAWNAFAKLSWTDDSYVIHDLKGLSYADLLDAFLPEGKGSLEKRFADLMNWEVTDEKMERFEWLGLFDRKNMIKLNEGSPAMILQKLLEEKWKLEEDDKDMIVMQHQFIYEIDGKEKKEFSELVVIGEDIVRTAMAKTVGLPLGILAKLILTKKINLTGVQIPIMQEVYHPVLRELENFGVKFVEY